MAIFFPQINSNYILTQLPYESGSAYETVVQDLESGPRFAYPRRGSGLDGYPTKPLFSGVLNFTNITDAEVVTLHAFFDSMCGRYGRFSIADPGGNLFPYSEDFSQVYWGSGPSQGLSDPYGHPFATTSAAISGTVFAINQGPASAMVLCCSLWCYATSSGQSVTITISSANGSFSKAIPLPSNSWFRADFNSLVSGSGQNVIGSFSSFSGRMFGAQCSPMKGPGGYVWTGGPNTSGYGYRPICRFDVDAFDLAMVGPNQNVVRLPVVELNS